MKSRSKVIIITIISLMLMCGAIILLVSPFGNKIKNFIGIDNTKEEFYTAYISINPLVKLTFKVSCQNDECSEPKITASELINEDAKIIYKELEFKDKTLKETVELLASTVKDNEIAFKEVHIYTNYDKEDEFKVDNSDYEIILDIKENEALEQSIDKLIVEEANKKKKEILVPVTYPKSLHDRGLGPTNLKPLEHEELFVKEYEIIAESDNAQIPSLRIPLTYVKITVLGPAEVIDALKEKYDIRDGSYIYGLIDATGLDKGTYTLPMQFNIKGIENVEVITPSIECQIEIVSQEEMPFPLEPF